MGHYVIDLIYYIVHWIYCSKIGTLCSGPNSIRSVYNPLIVELGGYVLDPICYILNLINLRQLLKKWAMQLKKLDIYVLAFLVTQNGVSMPIIGLSHKC
jgi:hypothetical protein